MHNYKIDKSLDFLQKAVSNNSPLFKDIAFTFEGKKQYDIYKRKLELAFPGRDVDFMSVATHLLKIYSQFFTDFKSIESMIVKIDSNQTDLKPKFQSQKLSELLNTNLSNLCKALQEIRLYRYFVI